MNICNFSIILSILIGLTITNGIYGRPDVVYEWDVLKFATPEDYPVDRCYTGNTTLITGIEIGHNKIFVATPRVWAGNPASLSYFRKTMWDKSPLLHAYPNWDMHKNAESAFLNDCEGIISVFKMTLDKCGNLWVVDSGIKVTRPYRAPCPPKLLIFDTSTDELIKTVTFPSSMYQNASIYSTIVVETAKSDSNCEHSVAYIADATAGTLIMYNSTSNNTWMVSHPSMKPDPEYEQFTLFGDSFTLKDGISGIALDLEERVLYFTPYAGHEIFKVSLCDLAEDATPDGDLQNVTCVTKTTSQTGALAFGLPNKALMYCDAIHTNLVFFETESSKRKEVAYSPKHLQFVLDMKLRGDLFPQLWLVSTRLQKFLTLKTDLSETNLRLLAYSPTYADVFSNKGYH